MLTTLVGAVALFIFGALWYTVLFGKTWAKLMGFRAEDEEKMKKESMVKPMIINFLVNIIVACSVVYIYPQVLSLSLVEFAKTMLVVWFGFAFPVYVNQVLWEKKSWNLLLLNSANGVVGTIIISAIVYLMM